ncbi:hypothetical protein DM860_009814 [Cuscuta australis]|uniref:RGS1-HXK1-interacting protein 1 n=1 Tax=Cuscuta australis TaxID=267555 RepID=A0A328DB24_9ASTE|nr:hypothetical protein DM860_009814 [Cuscuta australis]
MDTEVPSTDNVSSLPGPAAEVPSPEINASSSAAPIPPPSASPMQRDKPWHTYISEDLPRTVQESTDSAIRSARSFQNSSSFHLRSLQDFLPQLSSQYRAYEDVFFKKVKDEIISAREHPTLAGGIVVASALMLMRGPRRFIFRNTLGRFQSEEARFNKAEKKVKELSISVDLMKNESKKLLQRVVRAHEDMTHGHSELMNAGAGIQSLTKAVNKAEAQATDLMDLLREIPGREPIKLRAEVASMASHLRQQKKALGKRIVKISDMGVPV